jgi:hypothetical protein
MEKLVVINFPFGLENDESIVLSERRKLQKISQLIKSSFLDEKDFPVGVFSCGASPNNKRLWYFLGDLCPAIFRSLEGSRSVQHYREIEGISSDLAHKIWNFVLFFSRNAGERFSKSPEIKSIIILTDDIAGELVLHIARDRSISTDGIQPSFFEKIEKGNGAIFDFRKKVLTMVS